jgi:hypothetical protein
LPSFVERRMRRCDARNLLFHVTWNIHFRETSSEA